MRHVKDRSLVKSEAYVGGRWVHGTGKKAFEVRNPSNGKVLTEVADLSPKQVEKAIGAAQKAMPAWSALTGQAFADYQGFGWADAVHPDDAQPTIDAWNAAVEAKGMFVFEHRVRRHCGSWRTFAVRALPVLGAVIVLAPGR